MELNLERKANSLSGIHCSKLQSQLVDLLSLSIMVLIIITKTRKSIIFFVYILYF
jgi:hypothetical protein